MTEQEWDTGTDPQGMFQVLRGKATARKLRLYAVACYRRHWDCLPGEGARQVVEVAERFADGQATRKELRAARTRAERAARQAGWLAPWHGPYNVTFDAAAEAAYGALWDGVTAAHITAEATTADIPAEEVRSAERAIQCVLLRDLFGPLLFRPPPPPDPSWLAWREGTVARLARAIYEGRRLPEGNLDTSLLAVLADALEEAGCADAELLGHLRAPGPHLRGCWAIDRLLARK